VSADAALVMEERSRSMTRKTMVLMVLFALVVTACGPRSSGSGFDTTTMPDPVPTVPAGAKPDAPSDQNLESAPGQKATTASIADRTPEPDSPPQSPEDGVQVEPTEVEIPDVDELDQLLADVDAALAGIDLDATEGDLP
jgi:hypothetical protein